MATNFLDTSGLTELLKKLKAKFATKADTSTVNSLQSKVDDKVDFSYLDTNYYSKERTYSQEQIDSMALGCTVHTEGGRTYATVEDMESGDTTELVAGDRCFITADNSVRIWDGAQWVLALDENTGVPREELENSYVQQAAIVQTTGDATDKVMSQKAVTDALASPSSYQPMSCEGVQLPKMKFIEGYLTTEQVAKINALDEITVRVVYRWQLASYAYPWLFVTSKFGLTKDYADRPTTTTTTTTQSSQLKNNFDSALAQNRSVLAFSINRTTGVVKLYCGDQLLATQTHDYLVLDSFIGDDGYFKFGYSMGQYLCAFYQIDIFGGDIYRGDIDDATYTMTNIDIGDYGASMLPDNMTNKMSASVRRVKPKSMYGYNTSVKQGTDTDGYCHIYGDEVPNNSNKNIANHFVPLYSTNITSSSGMVKLRIKIKSGTFKFTEGKAAGGGLFIMSVSSYVKLYNADTLTEVDDYTAVGAGEYDYCCYSGNMMIGIMGFWITAAPFDMEFQWYEEHPYQCIAHIPMDVIFGGDKFYDYKNDIYYKMTNLTPSMLKYGDSTTNINYKPAFQGQMAYVGGKAYVGVFSGTDRLWKQISN